MFELNPLVILGIGIISVVVMIVVLRINAFLALIVSAIAVSLLSPGVAAEKITRVALAFGNTAGGIGIVIAMASIIGVCLIESGAADRIVRSLANRLGIKRVPGALMGSGFLLSMPVFFDTVFYLLVPLARSLYRQLRSNYILFIMAICAGGVVTHVMIPPTPGPLIMAANLDISVGVMIAVGMLVAVPMAIAGLGASYVINRVMPIPMRELSVEDEEPVARLEPEQLPGLFVSLLPIVLPVVLISSATILSMLVEELDASGNLALHTFANITAVIGNANFALIVSAIFAMLLLKKERSLSLVQLAEKVEKALMSGGLIILITAAGGAFGKMLAVAGIGDAIQASVGDVSGRGVFMLFLSFGVAALMKVAQGSSTVSMITTSAMIAAMGVSAEQLGFNPVYLATVIGSGSVVGVWMNDSGFWIVSRMSGLTVVETLRSFSILLATIGVTGLITTILFSQILPLTG
jgi:GntP family gluconate:H+ symporter